MDAHTSYYQKIIIGELQCSTDDAEIIENIMRNEIYNGGTLDWQTAAQLKRAALDSQRRLIANRSLYEQQVREITEICERERTACATS